LQSASERTRRGIIRVFTECFANKWFVMTLCERLSVRRKIRHSRKSSRDRVIKDLKEYILSSSEEEATAVLAVIDYEKGRMRPYIDALLNEFLRTEKQRIDNSLVVAYERERRVVVIVFDPNIEEALLCRADRRLCRDKDLLRRIKSKRGPEFLQGRLRNNPYIRSITERVAKTMEELLQ